MTSERRITANRAYACKSTGPRTPAGKSKSSHNAFRHGLETTHILDPLTQEKVKRLAAMICGDGADPIEQELATRIAECQLMISRVRAARIQAVERLRVTGVPSYLPSYAWSAQLEESIAAMRAGKPRKGSQLIREMAASASIVQQEATLDVEARRRSLAGEELSPELAVKYVRGERCSRSDADSFHLALPQLLAVE